MLSQKKTFLIFWETEAPKNFSIFQEMELSHISGNGIFRAPKMKTKPTLKKRLIFREMELS